MSSKELCCICRVTPVASGKMCKSCRYRQKLNQKMGKPSIQKACQPTAVSRRVKIPKEEKKKAPFEIFTGPGSAKIEYGLMGVLISLPLFLFSPVAAIVMMSLGGCIAVVGAFEK